MAQAAVSEEELKKAFCFFDKDGNGRLDRDEFSAILSSSGSGALSQAELDRMYEDADFDTSGGVDVDEFVLWLTRGSVLCKWGCGRPAFAPHPTCCVKCAGPGSTHNRTCKTHGTARQLPPGADAVGSWACSKCSFVNMASDASCALCLAHDNALCRISEAQKVMAHAAQAAQAADKDTQDANDALADLRAKLELQKAAADEADRQCAVEAKRLKQMQAQAALDAKQADLGPQDSKRADLDLQRAVTQADADLAAMHKRAEEDAMRLAKATAGLEADRRLVEQKRKDAAARAHRSKALSSLPPWWSIKSLSQDMRMYNVMGDSNLRAALQGCLKVQRPDWLGKGADQADEYLVGSYDGLQLANAWRCENAALYTMYQAGKDKVSASMQGRPADYLKKCKIRPDFFNAGSKLAKASGFHLDGHVNECFLMHGCSPFLLMNLASDGLNERFAGSGAGSAFGDGSYLADDAGKTDQYSLQDEYFGEPYDSTQYKASRGSYERQYLKPLHEKLYPGGPKHHPGHVFYMWVCRVTLGYTFLTVEGDVKAKGKDSHGAGETLWAMGGSNKRELAPMPDSTAPAHALQVLCKAKGGRLRYSEYVVFNATTIYPEYLVAYQRVNSKGGSAGHGPAPPRSAPPPAGGGGHDRLRVSRTDVRGGELNDTWDRKKHKGVWQDKCGRPVFCRQGDHADTISYDGTSWIISGADQEPIFIHSNDQTSNYPPPHSWSSTKKGHPTPLISYGPGL